MRKPRPHPILIVLTGLLLLTVPLDATTVLKLNLEQMVNRAGRIFRGSVTDINTGTVQAGGGTLPTVTYVFNVEEAFKGDIPMKEGGGTVSITMVGTIKRQGVRVGNAERFAVLPDLPKLARGGEYLIFATAESQLGLSTAVGLGQGSFTVFTQDRQLMAVNEVDNANIGESGPVRYEQLAAAVNALLGK
jgi:hypothetical protein